MPRTGASTLAVQVTLYLVTYECVDLVIVVERDKEVLVPEDVLVVVDNVHLDLDVVRSRPHGRARGAPNTN